jgi:DNA-binding response OmpR family regulator
LESALLRYLFINSGRAISRDELLANVWRLTPVGLSTRTVDMQIARLREKLKDNPNSPRVVRTVRGVGYVFAANGQGD